MYNLQKLCTAFLCRFTMWFFDYVEYKTKQRTEPQFVPFRGAVVFNTVPVPTRIMTFWFSTLTVSALGIRQRTPLDYRTGYRNSFWVRGPIFLPPLMLLGNLAFPNPRLHNGAVDNSCGAGAEHFF